MNVQSKTLPNDSAPDMTARGLAWDHRTKDSLISFAILFPVIIAIVGIALFFGLASKTLLMLGCVNVIAAVGLGLFSGTSGILSLGHVAFFGIGAYVTTWFTLSPDLKSFLLADMPEFIKNVEWPLPLALVVGVLACALVGAVFGIVMMRLRDTAAVIASFGLVIIAYLIFIGAKTLTNGKQSLYALPTDQANWWVILGSVGVALGAAFYLKATKYSRHLEAVRDEEQAARSVGIEPQINIFIFWVASAAIVGLAGGLYAHVVGVISPNGFYLEKTFALVVMIILGGYRAISGCVVGAVVITIAEEIFRKTEEHLSTFAGTELIWGFEFPMVFGLTAISFSILILIVLYLRPEGVLGYRELATMLFAPQADADPQDGTAPGAAFKVQGDNKLATEGLSKSYGGLQALSDVTLHVDAGEIVGLIGPNGAGKTTFINVLTGILFATSGKISINHSDATLWSAHRLARAGLGRTYQNIRLFSSLTALENVICAVTVKTPGIGRRQAQVRARSWLVLLNLQDKGDTLSCNLAYGDQRRLEIARALALEPNFLLLDEPAAGMNAQETQDLKILLQKIVDDFGVGVLLVEHDLKMVMELCHRIYVLNKGELIANGTPKEVSANAHVIEAYVGEDEEDT